MADKEATLRELLRQVYEKHGPREGDAAVDPERFAKLTEREVSLLWDFDGRLLMHKIARAIVT